MTTFGAIHVNARKGVELREIHIRQEGHFRRHDNAAGHPIYICQASSWQKGQ